MNVKRLEAAVYRIPTERPEADGTLAWDSTTIVVVEVETDGGARGLGYSYTAAAASYLIAEYGRSEIVGQAGEPAALTERLVDRLRNVGVPGVAACAIAAVDTALWDAQARQLNVPLVTLLGRRRDAVPAYRSGLFTTYSVDELAKQATSWVDAGIGSTKMKIGVDGGTSPRTDIARVEAVRNAIGADMNLMVDANGAYGAKQAIDVAHSLAGLGISYFKEPVPSDRPHQLAFVRERAPMAVASGEYAYTAGDFLALLRAYAVDILQADVTRCLGVTGWMAAAGLAGGFGVGFSAHTAAGLHAHLACAAPVIDHVEYFHDHVIIEGMLFGGIPKLVDGCLHADPHAPGLGLTLKQTEAARWRVA